MEGFFGAYMDFLNGLVFFQLSDTCRLHSHPAISLGNRVNADGVIRRRVEIF